MSTDDVWALVDQARRELGADTGRDVSAGDIVERMTALLAQRDVADIVAFQQPLWDLLAQSYRADLWAAAYLINGGASDDGFEYFRGWLIAQGRAEYERALADPDSLADVPEIVTAGVWGGVECEDMLGVAWDAHRAITGEELPPRSWSISYPQLGPACDFDFDDEAEMRRRLPRLATLCYDRDGDLDDDDLGEEDLGEEDLGD